jgi:predicted XRE-type DNA-binding protein
MKPKKAYDDHRRHAMDRGIGWQMPYEDWLEMWLESGKWSQRGKVKGKYQMCRYGDTGPYNSKNCYIGSVEQNQEDRSQIDIQTVKAIVFEYLSTNKSQYEVAKEFDVDQSYVSRLVNKHRRNHGQIHSTSN